MNVTIRFSETPLESDSQALEQLADRLAKHNPTVARNDSVAGRKDGGLALAVAIVGAASSVLGTIISGIALWRSTVPNCTVTLTRGGLTESIGNLSPQDALALVEKIEKDTSDEIQVVITRQ